MPKVSVILTSYNHAKYLRESINSCLSQTYSDFELFILDDASTDNSWEIINNYNDIRIKKHRNEKNEYAIKTMHKIISELAIGEYIAIHHSDDVWESTKLEKQVAFLDEHKDYGAVFTNAVAINEEGSTFKDENHFYYSIFNQPNRTRHEWLNYFFYQGNALCHPSVLIRKKCYDDCGLYTYGLAQLTDYDMWIRLCLKYEIYIMPEKLVRFRIRENEANTSGNKPESRIRENTEFYYTQKHFLEIKSQEDMFLVFPEFKKYINEKGFEPNFILAMSALEPKARKFTKLFGFSLLYELVNNKDKAKNIKDLYNFDYMNLIEISSKHDVFSVEELANLNAIIYPQKNIHLYLDTGSGFNELELIIKPFELTTGTHEFSFDLSNYNNLSGLRLDPLNESAVIEIDQITIETENSVIDLSNRIQANVCTWDGHNYFFNSQDPQIYFDGLGLDELEGSKELCIKLRYVHTGRDAQYICTLQLTEERDRITEERDRIINSNRWGVVNGIYRVAEKIKLLWVLKLIRKIKRRIFN